MPPGIAWRLSRRNILRHRSFSDLFSGTHAVYGIDFNFLPRHVRSGSPGNGPDVAVFFLDNFIQSRSTGTSIADVFPLIERVVPLHA